MPPTSVPTRGSAVADRASALTGAVLADDMGLGKTMQVLALTAAEVARRGPRPTPWTSPTDRPGRGPADPAVHLGAGGGHVRAGADRRDATAEPRPGGRAPHDSPRRTGAHLLRDGARDVGLLAGMPWRRLVADEAQTIKNPTTGCRGRSWRSRPSTGSPSPVPRREPPRRTAAVLSSSTPGAGLGQYFPGTVRSPDRIPPGRVRRVPAARAREPARAAQTQIGSTGGRRPAGQAAHPGGRPAHP